MTRVSTREGRSLMPESGSRFYAAATGPLFGKARELTGSPLTRATANGVEVGAKAQRALDKEKETITPTASLVSLTLQAPSLYFGYKWVHMGLTWMSRGALEISAFALKKSLESPLTRGLIGFAFTTSLAKFGLSKIKHSVLAQTDPSSWKHTAVRASDWFISASVAAVVQLTPFLQLIPNEFSIKGLLNNLDINTNDVLKGFDDQRDINQAVNNFAVGLVMVTAPLALDWLYQKYISSPKTVQNFFNRLKGAG